MALEAGLHLNLQQKLTMTPRLQQSIQMLQMTVQELSQLIEQEMLVNPTLDLEKPAEEVTKAVDGIEAAAGEYEREDSNLEKESQIDWDAWFDHTEMTSRTGTAIAGRGDGDEEEGSLTDRATREETLQEKLLVQLHLNTFSEEDFKIGEFLIGNIDPAGYLRVNVEETSRWLEKDPADVEELVELIQSFEPHGVGARNLRECLLNQYRMSDDYHPDDIIEQVLDQHLEDLADRKFRQIARTLSTTPEEIQDVLDYISDQLDPKPGSSWPSATDAQFIRPDVRVTRGDDGWVVTLIDDILPKLFINTRYREMMRDKENTGKVERRFIKDKMDSALWLIRSIQQRKETILKVSQAIVEAQTGFLDHGISRFRPMTLKDIAIEIGMHESTVSRVTTGKFMETPRGVFELKYFFSTGLSTSGTGPDVSSLSVKAKIKSLVDNENPRKPLSDQKIVIHLNAEGIDIARRTVAKYREELGISSSSQRRRL